MNAIIDWSDKEVWEFIKGNVMPYCSLYDEGYTRLGCIMCPMSNKRVKEAERFPKYKKAFMLAFDRLYERKKHQDNVGGKWKSGEEMFCWWLHENRKKANPDQMVMFE